ncbi:unnamed protein product [Prunus armeniaca]
MAKAKSRRSNSHSRTRESQSLRICHWPTATSQQRSVSHTQILLHAPPPPPGKQQVNGSSIPLNTGSKSSSPTALGLVLQLSIFRELVQKNSNFSEDESTDGEETKDQPQAGLGSDDEFGGIFYDGIGDNPFACSFQF